MSNLINIQDHYLNTLRKKNITVTIFLTNGFQLRGRIKAFDNFTILFDSDGKEQLIYKHAISTFVPARNINYTETD